MDKAARPGAVLNFVEGWRKTVHLNSDFVGPEPHTNQVVVCIAQVQQITNTIACQDILCAEDVFALDQIQHAAARDSARAARVLLRAGLSFMMNGCIQPSAWCIRTLPHGSPIIGEGFPNFKISISHTDRIALVAISSHLPVGIDVELVDQHIAKEVVETYCCAAERLALGSVPPEYNSREFLRLWTLKESYTKMLGLGHAVEFDSLGFSFETPRLLDGVIGRPGCEAHFETMFVADCNTLNHVSVAIGVHPSHRTQTELKFMALLASGAEDGALQMPYVSPPSLITPKL